jgi:hypothetical protein
MHDHRHAFWFDVNPYGVQLDGVTTDGIGDDLTWEGLWYSDAMITADGYVVLASIPFRTLRFSNATKQQWGFALGHTAQHHILAVVVEVQDARARVQLPRPRDVSLGREHQRVSAEPLR